METADSEAVSWSRGERNTDAAGSAIEARQEIGKTEITARHAQLKQFNVDVRKLLVLMECISVMFNLYVVVAINTLKSRPK